MKEEYIDSEEFFRILKNACKAMVSNYIEKLRKLDAAIGDGDLGITIKKGCTAVADYLGSVEDKKDIGKILRQCGMQFNEANPSTFGVFTATALMKGGGVVKGKEKVNLDDIKNIFSAAEKGIMKKGNASPGDKTILDALHPAVEELKKSVDKELSIKDALDNACNAAQEGMLKTIDMKAKMGRARSFGERTVGEQDPGATVVFYSLKEIVKAIK